MRDDVKKYLLDGTMTSIKMILNVPYSIGEITAKVPDYASLRAVKINLSGACKGSITIQGELPVYSFIGEGLFGMPVTGELLDSFIGEFANMLTGNIATLLSNHGLNTDISTPMIVTMDVEQYECPLTIPIKIENKGNLFITLVDPF